MDGLSRLADAAEASAKLGPLVAEYREWIKKQATKVPVVPAQRRETGKDLLDRASIAAGRIERGIALLSDPTCLEAFRLANRAMAEAARRRQGVMEGKPPESVQPGWRPFQLAFLLMNLEAISAPVSDDR